jgi:alcohol dehydrogenase
VQFAAKVGFRTVAIARGVADELRNLGGAAVVGATAANADAISATIDGLAPHGELPTLAVLTDSLHVTPLQLIISSGTVHGHPGGVARDVEDTMNFAALQGTRPVIEPLSSC